MTLTSALPRAGALAAALFLTALAAPASAQTSGDRTVLSVGHTDAMQVTYENDEMGLRVKDDTGDSVKFHDPADVLFQVLPHAEMAVPEGGALDFIGEPGDPIWLLPFSQDHTLLWPGWSTEELNTGVFKGDKVTMSLVGAEGPGDVALWGLGNFGTPNVWFNSRDALPDSIDVNVNSHVHSTWAFTAPGEYTLSWEFTGALADGTEVSTGSVDYHWIVGELPGEDPGDPDPDPGDPAAPDLDDRLILDEGHVDVLSTTIEGDALSLKVKDGTRLHAPDTVERDPDDVAFHAVPESELVLSQEVIDYWQVGDRYSAGDSVWWLPDSQQQGVLFAGWNSDIAGGLLKDDALSLEFTDFSGPGDLLMFMPGDGIEPTILYADTADGLPDTIATRARTHAHTDWLFSEPGVYTLTWRATAVLTDGTPISSDPEEFVFVVGEWPAEDPDDPDDPGNPELESTQTITATVDTDAGGLVISVDPDDRDVVLPAMALNSTATRWTTEGELRPVTVTDTRSADPGWNAAAQVSEFASDAGGFSSSHLGWLPGVVSTGDTQQVAPGSAVEGELDGGPGLATSQILAAAAAGAGKGTCVLGADLHLDLPTDVESGTYTALVTFTAI
jgi:surface-anchored protein